MTFQEVLTQAVKWLQRDRRISFRALKRQFAIDDDYLDDLKEAITYTYPQMVEEDGRGLVWTGVSETPESSTRHGKEVKTRFQALLPVAMMLLQREKRVTYQALKSIFGIDDELLEILRKELLFKEVVRDMAGEGLVWTGEIQSVSVSSTAYQTSPAPPDVIGTRSTSPPESGLIGTESEKSNGDIAVSKGPALITPEAERRHLTVMFCDLAESTKLAGQLDPEDLREVIRAYQATAADVIQHFESYIAQYLGDGLLVYFGWPQAHEDDTQRAIYTGLGIIDAIATTLNKRLKAEKGVRLDVRIGIHTGPVVVGEMGGGGRHEQLATGETINIAARLQSLAAPNTMVISNTTASLVQEAFVLEDMGPQILKGVDKPIRVSRVCGPIEGHEVEDHTDSAKVPFLVGRDEEIGLLLRRWEQSKEGIGQVILISGEAGIGKSALVERLYTQLAQDLEARVTFRCSQYHRNSALYPVITHVERVFGFIRDDTSEMKVGKMERVLQPSKMSLEEGIPLLASLLSVSLPEGQYTELALSPQHQRQQTQDLLVAWLQEESEQQLVLVVWEDLHWADPSTLELLELFIDQAPTVKMMHVLTFRSDFVAPWPQRSHMTPLVINRLEKTQVEAMIRHMAGGKELPREVVEHIMTKTDGVPLYIEELTKTVLESQLLRDDTKRYILTGPLSDVAIPVTLHDSLMARLDRVPVVREVAQLGAVLGREFVYEMLLAMATMEESTLLEGLSRLVEHELLYQRGRPPRAKYIFKHALVHEAAYRSLLRRTRRQYHQAAAELLENQFPVLVRTEPEMVAHHYTEADCPEQAIKYWDQAGDRARQRSAHVEAIAHLSKALEILATLPETAERTQDELAVLLAIGPSLIAVKGYAAHEVEQIYSRARTLCRQMGETAQLFPMLWGLWGFYVVRANHQDAREVGEELLKLANGQKDAIYRVESHLALGSALYCLEEFVPASKYLEQGADLYVSEQHQSYTSLFGADLGIFCSAWAAHPLWHIGFPDRALTRSLKAVNLAEKLEHPFSMALALDYAAIFHQFRRESRIAYQRAEAAIAVCSEQNFAYYLGWAMIIKGWALADQGECEEGMAEIHQGLKTLRDTGAKRSLPYYLSLLAEVYGMKGQAEEGLRIISDAFVEAQNIAEHWWEAELYRLKGALLLQKPEPDTAQVEASFHQALDVARRQQSKSLELRAATSLCRLWQQQGKREEAHQLLTKVYNCFVEGFDTADLREAKALLDEQAN